MDKKRAQRTKTVRLLVTVVSSHLDFIQTNEYLLINSPLIKKTKKNNVVRDQCIRCGDEGNNSPVVQ